MKQKKPKQTETSKPFSEQYKDPRWQKKRLEILQRDDFSCVRCGSSESELHVHHIYYEKNTDIWDYNEYALTTLCNVCHENIHNEMSLFKFSITKLARNFISGQRPNFEDAYCFISSCDDLESDVPLEIAMKIIASFLEIRRDGYYEGLSNGVNDSINHGDEG